MNRSRRTFLQSAGAVAVTGTAFAVPEVVEGKKITDSLVDKLWSSPYILTVHVYNQSNGALIPDATVHLEPRFNGLALEEDTDVMTGNAVFPSGQDGRYDVEVSHPDFQPGFLGNKNFTVSTLPMTVYCPLQP